MYELIYFGIGFAIAGWMWFTHDHAAGDEAAVLIISIMMIFAWGFLVPFVFVMAAWDWLSHSLAQRKRQSSRKG